jgi:hypothetical protein|eukprot:COSAG06_NODE_4700_length_4026_cov_2.671505_1_plen_40_part_00
MHSGMLVVEYMLADEGPGDGGMISQSKLQTHSRKDFPTQ